MILNHKNIATARAIQRAVTYRNKGTVIAVYYANQPAKEKVTAYLQESLKGFSFSTVNISYTTTKGLIDKLKSEAQQTQGDKIKHIVFVDGFDTLEDMSIIKDLNMFREAFFREFNRLIIVFLIPKDKESRFRFNAADFWDWISYSFYIEKEHTEEQTVLEAQEVDNTETQHSSSEIFNRRQQEQERRQEQQQIRNEENIEPEQSQEQETATDISQEELPEQQTQTEVTREHEEPAETAEQPVAEETKDEPSSNIYPGGEREEAQAILNRMNANNEKPPQSLIETLLRNSVSAVEFDKFMSLARKYNYTIQPELIRSFFGKIEDKEQAILSLNFLQSKGYEIPSDIIRSITGKDREEETKTAYSTVIVKSYLALLFFWSFTSI